MLNDTLKSLLFILFFVSVPNLNAKTLSYRHFSVEDGLPSSEVYDVLEDDQGFMWFATDRGAVRFDGYQFEVFNTDKGLPDNVILSLFKDHKGRIWFVSYSGKLSYFENDRIKLYPFNPLIAEQLESPIIISFFVDSLDNVHLGTFSQGYLQINVKGLYTNDKSKQGYSNNLVKVGDHFVFFRASRLKYIYENVLRIIEGSHEEIIEIPTYSTEYKGISKSCYNPMNGTLYFSIENYLFSYDTENNIQIKKVFSERITTIQTHSDQIWVGVYKNGYIVLDETQNEILSSDLIELSITNIYHSDENGIWITTLENGIYYCAKTSAFSFTQEDGIAADYIYQLESTDNQLFMSDVSGSISVIDEDNYTINKVVHMEMRAIPLYKNPYDSSLLLFGTKEVISINAKKQIFRLKSFVPLCFIAPDQIFGRILQESEAKFGVLELNTFHPYEIDGLFQYQGSINNAHHSRPNRFLLGCKDGLRELIHPSPGDSIYHLKNWGEVNSLFKTRIIEITDYPGFDFIAATRGEGLLFVRNNIPYAFKMKQGLSSNQITSIFVDDELSIWIGSSEGLSILKKTGELINLSIKDGLISNEVTDIYVNQKKAFIGTKKGLTVLDKDEIKKHINDIPVLFRSIKNQHDVEMEIHDGKLDVAYKEPIISLSYAGIHFPSMGRISYRYRLNANENWLYTKNHELLLTNLPSGKYELEIYASNDNTNWSSVPARLSINIAYPFWQTWAFIIIMIFAGMIALYLIYRLIIRRIRNKEKIKRQIQNLRFEALSAQMNPHFMFNSLNSIQNFIMNNDRKSSTRYLSKFAKLMRNTLEHSKLKHITLSEEIETLTLYLELESLRFDHLIKYTINISDELNPNRVLFPALLIQPMVENAIIHGLRPRKTGGKIDIFFERKDSSLIISVSDDGVGRNYKDKAENHHQSSGTKLTVERISLFAKEHNSRFSFNITDRKNNNSNSGTTVHITIPYIITHENKNHNY